MQTRRIATAALLVALFGAACGGGGSKVAADEPASVLGVIIERSTTTTSTTSTTTTTTPPAVEPIADLAPAAPVVKPAPRPAPEPVGIDVYYSPAENESAVATIDGPSGSLSQPVSGGVASFDGLDAGTYSVIVTVEQASGDPTIDPSQFILNGNSIDLEPGQRAAVSCDSNGCSGVLAG